jgi:hypothetical protein
MADTYVAVTDFKIGLADGQVERLSRGEEIDASDFTDEDHKILGELLMSGSVAVKGSPQDPNTWPKDERPYETTPAVVEAALRAQALHDLAGVDVPDGVSTQPGNNTPSDAKSLLIGEHVPDQDELVEPGRSLTSAGGPASQSQYGVHLNAESDPNTEGAVQQESPAAAPTEAPEPTEHQEQVPPAPTEPTE